MRRIHYCNIQVLRNAMEVVEYGSAHISVTKVQRDYCYERVGVLHFLLKKHYETVEWLLT